MRSHDRNVATKRDAIVVAKFIYRRRAPYSPAQFAKKPPKSFRAYGVMARQSDQSLRGQLG